MTSKSDIKRGLKDGLKAIEDKIADLEKEADGFRSALAALNGAPTETRTPSKPRERRFSVEPRILDLLRQHPDKAFDPATISRELDLGISTAGGSVRRLLAKGKATKAGETKRGFPKIKHKPETVMPFEGIPRDDAPDTDSLGQPL